MKCVGITQRLSMTILGLPQCKGTNEKMIKINSPLRRIGLLCVCLSVSYLFGTAIFWNFSHGAFIRYESGEVDVTPPEVKVNQLGTSWLMTLGGWTQFNRDCQEAEEASEKLRNPPRLGIPLPQSRSSVVPKCTIRTIDRKLEPYSKWSSTFESFLGHLFDERHEGGLGAHGAAALVILLLGGFLVFGFVEVLIKWVVQGQS
jgi:hypothetical protein